MYFSLYLLGITMTDLTKKFKIGGALRKADAKLQNLGEWTPVDPDGNVEFRVASQKSSLYEKTFRGVVLDIQKRYHNQTERTNRILDKQKELAAEMLVTGARYKVYPLDDNDLPVIDDNGEQVFEWREGFAFQTDEGVEEIPFSKANVKKAFSLSDLYYDAVITKSGSEEDYLVSKLEEDKSKSS
jgi:hypothetical protein